MSQKAKLIERNSSQQKCAEFLRNKIGYFFTGTIIRVTDLQMTIELSESGIQGRILLRSLLDDRYRLDYSTYTIQGRKTGNCYRIGDELRVRLVYVDVARGLIDFAVN
jgi:ribonuclease R